MHDLGAIVKAYDIRGVVPDELDAEVAEAVGRAAAVELGAPAIVVGRDMRPSSQELSGAFMAGVREQGVDTIDAGLASTDLVYFASGRLGVPGAMFTASHNPAEYNGIKLCRAGAEPVSLDSGLAEIRDRAQSGDLPRAGSPGGHREQDMLSDYAQHVRSFVDVRAMQPLKVAVDAGNGMAGHVVPAVFEGLPLDVVPLYFELDGRFPNHPANPIEPENLRDVQKAVREHACDIGLAFDGDADRMFCVDEEGRPVSPSLVTAVIAETLLRRNPGATVLYNLITSRVVPETVEAAGGQAVRTRVGHSFIKARMKDTGAVFAGEHSGHYYFKDNFRADSGLIAAVLLLEALGASGGPLSKVVSPYDRYAASGEINRRVDDQREALRRVAEAFAGQGSQDFCDGLTHTGDGWWFNLRPSNTEPLLRLNVEADDVATMESVRDRVTALVGEA
ncbi:phosphomannomutase/phosphoglucomutase [soil metagenome]